MLAALAALFARYAFPAKLIGAGLLALLIAWHFIADARTRNERDRLRTEAKEWQRAHDTNTATIAKLMEALADQSARARDLAAKSEARQNAARIALRGATARRTASEVVAARIEAASPVAALQGQCRTAREVMDARGEL